MRERKNGYYGVSCFAVADLLSSAPFILACSFAVSLYFLVGLNTGGDRFIYFNLNLFISLLVVTPTSDCATEHAEHNPIAGLNGTDL